MKTCKRQPSEKAYIHGFRAGINGKSIDLCPYTQANIRSLWISGWREGWGQSFTGFTGIPKH